MLNKFTDAVAKLKRTGVRMTPQRHAVLAFLLESKTHPTADEIFKSLENQFPSMSLATVYNNLKVLVQFGLIRELIYGDTSSRYDANLENHYHANCVECGSLVDFDYPSLQSIESAAAEETGFLIQSHRFEVYGTCPNCAQAVSH